ncbi:MAG: type II toxin-antitoxin system VapC family toxin [Planctomycetaceae bacterium]
MTKRYLLDCGPAFDVMFRRRGAYERARDLRLKGSKIGIGLPTLGEIVAGVEGSSSRERSWSVVRRNVGEFVLWPFDKSAAYEFGRILADLRKRGRLMQHIDVMIAAIALTLGDCTVVTTDSDLSAIPGLKIENWSGS